MGHAERGKKLNMAVGMLDHSAGIAKAAGAELVVFHPGFLLGREREDAIDSVVEQLGELRERLEKKDRAVPFGVEIMGRVRELGTAEDVFAISSRCGWVRPVLDFAHLHAVTDGALHGGVGVRRGPRGRGRGASSPARRSTSTSPTSRSRTGTRRSTSPTARGRCARRRSAKRCAQFERPATVITESPDVESSRRDSRGALRGRRDALGEPRLELGRLALALERAQEVRVRRQDVEQDAAVLARR